MNLRRGTCGLLLISGLLAGRAEVHAEDQFQLPVRRVTQSQPDSSRSAERGTPGETTLAPTSYEEEPAEADPAAGSQAVPLPEAIPAPVTVPDPVTVPEPVAGPASRGADTVQPVAATSGNPFLHRSPGAGSPSNDDLTPASLAAPAVQQTASGSMPTADAAGTVAAGSVVVGADPFARPAPRYLVDTGVEGDLPPVPREAGPPMPPLLPPPPDAAAGPPEEKKEEKQEEGKDKEKKKVDDAELEKLLKEWEEFKKEREAKEKKALSQPTFDIGGRIHFDTAFFPNPSDGASYFENPDSGADPEARFFFRRIRLEMGGDILDTMLWRIQIDFNSPEDPEYKDVYIGWKELPLNHTVLLGNQKRPLGLDHLNSSRFNIFIERPLVVEAFNEDARRIGLAAYTHTDDLDYTFRYGIYTLENTTLDGTYIGDSLQMSANARLSGNPWYDEASGGRGYFHWAVAGMVAHPDGDVTPPDTNLNEARFRTRPEIRSSTRWLNTGRIPGAQWYEILAGEAMLNVGPLQIVSEYQTNWLQRDNTTPGTGPDLRFQGGYLYVNYMLTGEHVPYDRRTSTINRLKPFENFFLVERYCGERGTGRGWGAWGVGARLSYLDLSSNDIRGGEETNVTLALNWWWTAYSRLQFNAIYGDIDNHEPVGGFTDGHFTGITTRVMADF